MEFSIKTWKHIFLVSDEKKLADKEIIIFSIAYFQYLQYGYTLFQDGNLSLSELSGWSDTIKYLLQKLFSNVIPLGNCQKSDKLPKQHVSD